MINPLSRLFHCAIPDEKRESFHKLHPLKKITVVALTALANLGRLFCIHRPASKAWNSLIQCWGMTSKVQKNPVSTSGLPGDESHEFPDFIKVLPIDYMDTAEGYPDPIFSIFQKLLCKGSEKPFSNRQISFFEDKRAEFDEKLSETRPELKLDSEGIGKKCVEEGIEEGDWKNICILRYQVLSDVLKKPLVLYFFNERERLDGEPVEVQVDGSMEGAVKIAVANEPSIFCN